MRWLLFLLLAFPALAADDLCSTDIYRIGNVLETPVLQRAVEEAFGPATLVTDSGGESAVFRVKIDGLDQIVKVSRFQDAEERRRYLASATLHQRAVGIAIESPYRASARFLSQILGWRILSGNIPCKIERDRGSETLHMHLNPNFPGAIFARPTLADVKRLLRDLARALGGLHFGGFVHRDIKPDNISIRRIESGWTLSVLDFGLITKIGDTTAGRLGPGNSKFSRPAQLRGGPADPLDDLYSLGKILQQLIPHISPIEREDLDALANDLIGEKIPTIEVLLEKLE